VKAFDIEMPNASYIDRDKLSNSDTPGISNLWLRFIEYDRQEVEPKENDMQEQLSKLSLQPASGAVAAREQSMAFAELQGKTAIVTGSTSGIGLGIAIAFARAGMNVMLNGFGDEKSIEVTRSRIESEFGVGVAYSPADMSKPLDINAMTKEASRKFGQVDVLVNNAGIQHVEAIETFPVEKWNAIIAIDLSSAFHAIRAVVADMKSRNWGRIINIASAHGLVASPFKSAYVAAKHGLLGLTKTVALETAEFGITANAICPGYVLTPLVQKQIPETARARGISEDEVIKNVLLHAQPTKQFVTTEQIGALAVFLCTGAAASITGAALPVEGGWTAQ
jgi:3-hydroxybutyrate dehydrogenase